jgi:hypothetical protein
MLALISVPLAVAMIIEKATGRNFFSIFGGVPEFTVIRDGKLRCQGAFSHPILTGTFGATSMPFMLALWVQSSGMKLVAILGIISATIITIASASSGPALAYLIVIIGIAMWQIRDHMRIFRWSLLLTLIALHVVMKAPVWALIGKISEVVGGTGWHRVALIDTAISHFGEWWMLGTDYTRHWMPTGVSWSENHADITNQFIRVGINGGVLSLILFITVIVYCFKNIGLKLVEIGSTELPIKFAIWCMGVSLVGHVASFISVSYFDQIVVFWYLLLALITTVSTIPVETLFSNKSAVSPASEVNDP